MQNEVNETIKLVALFDGGKIIPIAFSWNGRRREKLKVESQWAMRKGQYLNEHFMLTDGVNQYEVAFSQERLSWKLVRVWER